MRARVRRTAACAPHGTTRPYDLPQKSGERRYTGVPGARCQVPGARCQWPVARRPFGRRDSMRNAVGAPSRSVSTGQGPSAEPASDDTTQRHREPFNPTSHH